ncbi:MerR family transcriptional regulator [Cohnella abietis]|uniref:HTH merR-type domain-containing protein n=1 Tax=Cohnella abietis TaxID=2507935 RepID=A0A3T1DE69_9BACL|nr:MerR family transcriptional regulator [Cohnella abietis]BBI36392.1 hypothetical protein KCTCHS21_57910 [Cohnella abietis]
MDVKKTKDASMLLGVSQTTVKKWASHYSSFFQKDHLGHYVFTDDDISLLQYIKEQIALGHTLDHIVPPVSPVSPVVELQQVPTNKNKQMDHTELLSRIREVERSVQQKADEVVSAQVLLHRAEIDEMRKMIAQLAATVETMQNVKSKPPSTYGELFLPAAEPTPIAPKKQSMFRYFF